MKKISVQFIATAATITTFLFLSASAFADSASETLYKAKCAACHGPSGSGSAMGTKLGAHDFHSAEVQGQSDTALTAIIASGKNKMPSYQKTLKPEEIAGLVAYIRSLSPAK
jgi:cytochrome c oxidase cbb3-type subunit 3